MPFSMDTSKHFNCQLFHMKFYGNLNMDDYIKFKETFNNCLKREPFGVIFDLRDAITIPTKLAMEQVKYMKEYESDAKHKLIASCIIISKNWMKTLLDGLFMIKKPISPNLVSKTYDDGEDFIKDYAELFSIQNKKKIYKQTVCVQST